MTERRRVRVSQTFFDRLDELLPEGREGEGSPSSADFLLHDMPAVIDRLALAYEASTAALEDGFDVRVLITAGVLVDFMAVYVTLASDGDVEIIYPLPRAPGMGRSDALRSVSPRQDLNCVVLCRTFCVRARLCFERLAAVARMVDRPHEGWADRSATAVAGGDVVVRPCPRAAPLTVVALVGAKTPPVRSNPQRPFSDPVADECGERHESARSGNGWDHETVEVVQHRASKHFPQWARVADIS